MMYLLYGEDTFRSRRKLKEIEEEYRRKHDVNNSLHWCDAQTHTPHECMGILDAGSLFSQKKLVIVEEASAYWDEQEVKKAAEKGSVSPDTIAVFWERAGGKNTQKLLRNMQTLAQKSHEFILLSGASLQKWIREEAAARGVALDARAVAYLESFGGGNLWTIVQEIEKKTVGYEGATTMAQEHKIFELGDLFFVDPQRALEKLLELQRDGMSEFDLFSYLANHCRTLLLIKEYAEKRQPVPPEFGVHPFVLKKAGALARQLCVQDLRRRLYTFFEEDWKIKTGLKKPAESLVSILFS